MPFLALAGPIAGALGASAATAGTIGAIGTAAGAVGSLVQANQAKQQAKGALGQAANATQVNIEDLNNRVKALATQNAQDSANLEKMLTPEVPQLRSAANNAVLGSINNNGLSSVEQQLQSRLNSPGAAPAQSPLLQAAIQQARNQLALGGNLPLDVQNAVTRQGLAKAGTVAQGGGLGLGRDVVARDLGLTSLDLMNQRLQNAGTLGQAELGGAQFNSGLQLQNNSNILQILQQLAGVQGQRFGQNLSAAQYGQSIAQPNVGIDPSSAANIAMGNANNQSTAYLNQANINAKQSQNYQTMAGNLAGYGLLNYNNAGGGTPYPQMLGQPGAKY